MIYKLDAEIALTLGVKNPYETWCLMTWNREMKCWQVIIKPNTFHNTFTYLGNHYVSD